MMATDDARLLPKTNLIETQAVPAHLLGPALAPGGVLGKYRDAKSEYRLLLVRLPSNEKAAFLLLDTKKAMTDPHYLPHMGGFAGKKDGQPFYVFAKGPFVAGIEGKQEPEADILARKFAARLPLQ